MVYRALSLLLALLAGFLLFWRLGSVPLWRDEATTATWARLMAESDQWVPRAFDGQQLIVQAGDGHDVNSRLLPAMQSWAQFYAAGASFKLLGVSVYTARLPFALIGLLSVFLLWRLGREIFGPTVLGLALPYLGLLSIDFLNTARQSRYYAIAVLAGLLMLGEIVRWLREPERTEKWGFYLRLALWGALLYSANYVGFAGLWAAVGALFLLLGQGAVLRRFLLVSAGLAVILGVEFWMLHSEFAGSWPPGGETPLLEQFKAALHNRGRDFWRSIALLPLLASVFLLIRKEAPKGLIALFAIGFAICAVPLLFPEWRSRDLSTGLFWLWALGCWVVPGALFWAYWRAAEKGLWVKLGLFCGLVLVISPLLAIAAAKSKAQARHYSHTVPVVALVGALVTAGVHRQRGVAYSLPVFALFLVWPNLNIGAGSMEQIVERQFAADDEYNLPLVEYLRDNVRPGERVCFLRTVKGMMVYFELPDIHWAGLLDADAPHNQQFRGQIPDDQFDDFGDFDWFVDYDKRDRDPKVDLERDYELVWEHEFDYYQSLWDTSGRRRGYRVYRRAAGQ